MMTFIFEDVANPETIRRERIRNRIILGIVIAAVVFGILYFVFKNYPEERAVKHFAAALEQGNYQEAYRIWQPNSSYTFASFMRDWGPYSDYAKVKTYKMVRSRSKGNGVVITLLLNNKEALLWVDRKTKSISFAPDEIIVMPSQQP